MNIATNFIYKTYNQDLSKLTAWFILEMTKFTPQTDIPHEIYGLVSTAFFIGYTKKEEEIKNLRKDKKQ